MECWFFPGMCGLSSSLTRWGLVSGDGCCKNLTGVLAAWPQRMLKPVPLEIQIQKQTHRMLTLFWSCPQKHQVNGMHAVIQKSKRSSIGAQKSQHTWLKKLVAVMRMLWRTMSCTSKPRLNTRLAMVKPFWPMGQEAGFRMQKSINLLTVLHQTNRGVTCSFTSDSDLVVLEAGKSRGFDFSCLANNAKTSSLTDSGEWCWWRPSNLAPNHSEMLGQWHGWLWIGKPQLLSSCNCGARKVSWYVWALMSFYRQCCPLSCWKSQSLLRLDIAPKENSKMMWRPNSLQLTHLRSTNAASFFTEGDLSSNALRKATCWKQQKHHFPLSATFHFPDSHSNIFVYKHIYYISTVTYKLLHFCCWFLASENMYYKEYE